MGQINVEVRVLNGASPLLLAWLNKDEDSVDMCLVTCPCQGYQLLDSKRDAQPGTAEDRELHTGRLTRAFESSEVISVLGWDLTPDISSVTMIDEKEDRGAKRWKRQRHKKKKKREMGTRNDKVPDKKGESVHASTDAVLEDQTECDVTHEHILGVFSAGDSKTTMTKKLTANNSEALQESQQSPCLDLPKRASPMRTTDLSDPPCGQGSNVGKVLSADLEALTSSDRSEGGKHQEDMSPGPHRGTVASNPGSTGNSPGVPPTITVDQVIEVTSINTAAVNQAGSYQLPDELPAEDQDMLNTIIDSVPETGSGEMDCGGGETEKEGQGPDASLPNTPQSSSVGQSEDSDKKPKKKKGVDKVVLCEVCGKSLAERSMKKHMETFHCEGGRDRTLKCDQCSSSFYDPHSLARHLRRHAGLRYQCRFCDKSYRQDWSRKVHENDHFPPDQPVYVCPRKKYVHPSVNVTCTICGKSLKEATMKTHMDTHTTKMFTCEICGAQVRYGSRYGHMKLHAQNRAHRCAICQMTFHFKSGLQMHQRTHTKERPIKCRYCDQTFSRYGTRINHERLHTGQRPYQCNLCEKGWRDRPTYMQHMSKHHPGSPLMYIKTRTPPITSKDRTKESATEHGAIATTTDSSAIAMAIESISQEIAQADQESAL